MGLLPGRRVGGGGGRDLDGFVGSGMLGGVKSRRDDILRFESPLGRGGLGGRG